MLKFLLIFFIVIYLLGYVGRFLLRRWITKITGHNMSENQHKQKPEGEVTINSKPKTSNSKFSDGEYVDYEEIKE